VLRGAWPIELEPEYSYRLIDRRPPGR